MNKKEIYEYLNKSVHPTGLNVKEPRGETACRWLEMLDRLEPSVLQWQEFTPPLSRKKQHPETIDPGRLAEQIRQIVKMGRPPKRSVY